MAKKFLREYSDTGVTFRDVSYAFYSKINTMLDEITKWATPQINSKVICTHAMTKREWTYEIETYNPRGTTFGFPASTLTPGIEREIKAKMIQAENKLNVPVTKFIMDQSGTPFAYNLTATGTWKYIFGSIDGWKDLTYGELAKLMDTANESKTILSFVWKIGDVLFASSTARCIDTIAALVLDRYCDKSIPADVETKTMAKMTRNGFGFLVFFLAKYLGQDPTRYDINLQYERLDKAQAIPFVPTKWQADTETIKATKLQAAVKKILNDKAEKTSPEDDITESMQEIKKRIESALGAENSITETINLSELLSERFSMIGLYELWNDEYVVNIDSDIIVKDVQIKEDKILIGVFSWGVLELLVTDDTISDNDIEKLEKEFEIEFGFPLAILKLSSHKGQEMLEFFAGTLQKGQQKK